MTVTGLGPITSNYGHLNGVSAAYYGGFGGYGYGAGYGGLSSTANAEQAKQRIANNYDVYATQQGYRSKQGVETVNYSQQCNLLAEDLKKGESDQASKRFEEMVNSMKDSPQYANYSDAEICALVRDQYATSTGSDLVADINKNTSNAFVQGFKRGIPLIGLMANKNSSADLVSQVTGNDKSRGEKAAKTVGYAAGAATSVGLASGAIHLLKKTNALSALKNTKAYNFLVKGKGKLGLAAVGIATVGAAIVSLFNNNKNTKTKKV